MRVEVGMGRPGESSGGKMEQLYLNINKKSKKKNKVIEHCALRSSKHFIDAEAVILII